MFILGVSLAVLIGVSLGLLGGGGSILTVPILLYVCRLPAEQVVWLVIGMALYRNDPIERVVEKLDLVIPDIDR